MFQKLLQKSILAIVLVGALILVSCSPVTESATDEAVLLEPDQVSTEPDVTVPEIEAPDQGEFGVPSTKISDGTITVLLSETQYKKGEIIAVTITNGLDQNIYTVDMKTGCTIVTLDKWNDSGWESLIECGMERSPLVFAIGSSLERSVLINPSSSAFGITQLQEPFLDVGTYRILFTYRLEPGREGDEPFSVYSKEFNIVP